MAILQLTNNREALRLPIQWVINLGVVTTIVLLAQLMMPSLNLNLAFTQQEKISWYLMRSSGVVAYLLMTGSMIWGLLLSSKVIKDFVSPALALSMHNTLSWTAIGLSIFHAAMLLFDTYFTYTWANLLIPFTGPYRPGWVGTGIIGFYLMLLTAVSFSWRKWIGQKTWRRLHYTTFVSYLLVTLHGYMAGTDQSSLTSVYLISSVSVVFLTFYRILDAWSQRKRRATAK